MRARILTVGAAKGGVGKTTLAYELAGALGGILVDLDWDAGGATRMWGYDPGRYRRAPLLDALEAGPDGPPPRPRVGQHRPLLVPAHPDLAASRIPDDLVADALLSWAGRWGSPCIVVDTHPGGNPLTDGAMQAADLVIVPIVLAAREMDALDGMLEDFAAYSLLLVPNMVPPVPPGRFVDRLARVTDAKGHVAVSPPVSEHRWLRRRLRRAALTLEPNPGARVRAAAEEFRRVASTVVETVGGVEATVSG
jgi:chromosome partitioning protein